MQVVDDVGVGGLTIRAVAGLVGAPPMSLYTHFANKEALLDLMYSEISRRLYHDSGRSTWQAELAALGLHVRGMLLAHPHWTPLLTRRRAPVSIPVRERILALMVADGIPLEQGVEYLTSAIMTTFGLTFVELSFRSADAPAGFETRSPSSRERVASPRPPSERPTPRAAFGEAHFDLERSFRLSLAALIAGYTANHQLFDARP